MPIATMSAPSGFMYSCSSVYSRSFGISATTCSLVSDGVVLRRGVYPRRKTVSRNSDCALGAGCFTHQRAPDVVHAALELCERPFVVDHEVGARTFELSRHLRRDHVHCLGGIETSIFHQSLVP